jgi:hypothetical protein
MSIMPDVVNAHLRLGRDVMLPSVMASDPALAHDPNAHPVEALTRKKPHVLST